MDMLSSQTADGCGETIPDTSVTGCHGADMEQSRSTKPVTRCEMCQVVAAKYTCPGCELRTCSLSCVKQHKTQLGCSGERNKAAFVDMSQYSDGHMLNDYRFLEDASRKLYSNKMPAEHRYKHYGSPYPNKRCKLLMTAAYKRGVKVHMVAPMLSKHKTNTSFYTIKTDKIVWHIEWNFVASKTLVKDEKVPEDTPLMDAAKKFVNFVEHPELRKPLEEYKKENLERSRFLLRVDGLPANRTRYFELKPDLSIAGNLKGHCLTEFPSIAVLPPSTGECAEFLLFSKDDLAYMESSNRVHMMKNLPGLNYQAELEQELINPHSDIFSTHTTPHT
ncbi:box C/D snoRNA protein 1-like [Physella acuta]|uniref:box C/D snoRNA protein 1-like n=1 Tax=Physella acuta TaxID=109671 RepID=UPI0027DD87B3|nr:box C/D snoRNA protein 1-like [Physella acuta]XP_059142811.1 box C/D snoRNA protein 1-like [Physella acuta]